MIKARLIVQYFLCTNFTIHSSMQIVPLCSTEQDMTNINNVTFFSYKNIFS